MAGETFDRKLEDLGNIIHLEHVNVHQPDQRLATLFYVIGLGGTRDPYLFVGLDNMWVNFGRSQFHMPTRDPMPQLLRGTTGLVVPDLAVTKKRLAQVAPQLAGTKFAWRDAGAHVEATCPWGNRFRLHAPAPEFGATDLGMPYVEFDVPVGTAEGIARFYPEVMGAPAHVTKRGGAPSTCVAVGRSQHLYFTETSAQLPEYDGHHVQIYIADFSGPYKWLLERGLVTMETNAHEWRFQTIVDPESEKPLFTIEHEVRSMRHPLFGRPLVNRNPSITNVNYVPGQDGFRGTY
jgi:hypothetical protein